MKRNKIIGLEFAKNMFGNLKPEIIKRVQVFIKKPNSDTWDDISSIIIDGKGKMKTIWNAVIDVDPLFPAWGRRTNLKGTVIRDWERVPTPDEVVKAINKCVFKEVLSSN